VAGGATGVSGFKLDALRGVTNAVLYVQDGSGTIGATNIGAVGAVQTITAGAGITATGTTNVTIAANLTGGTGIAITGTTNLTIAYRAPVVTGFTNLTTTPTGTTDMTNHVQMGLGATATYTPTRSGVCMLSWQVQASNTAATDGVTVFATYGTGAAPTNGVTNATATSNTIGTIYAVSNSVGGPANITYPAVLTPGTAYWFDLALTAAVGGTGAVARPALQITEF
jgi:hypothetical protein